MDDDARPAARLTVLSGPSGVGKDSVIELIRARSPWVWLSVSVTTRPKRDYETDGVHYHFVDRAEFQRMTEALLVFLAPPSVEELHRRLIGRGTEDPETIRLRLEHADEELAAEAEFDTTVVNDSIEHAADELL